MVVTRVIQTSAHRQSTRTIEKHKYERIAQLPLLFEKHPNKGCWLQCRRHSGPAYRTLHRGHRA